MKVNDNVKINQDNNNSNKENLFQRFSMKEQKLIAEKPVFTIYY